uniref:Uncharacterized protein n=1 Tax=Anguilla anguilla TaxID=7936 RepID=A0A0E9RCY8_ANGAN
MFLCHYGAHYFCLQHIKLNNRRVRGRKPVHFKNK